jgi:acyl carrier protein
MNPEKIREDTLFVFKEVFKETPSISGSTTADDIREWDSMNHMVLIHRLEKKFNIKFDLFRLMDLRSVDDFIQYLQQNITNGDQGS